VAELYDCVIALATLVCAAATCPSTGADKVTDAVPLSAADWTLDLRHYGYGDDPLVLPKIRLWTFHSAETFIADDRMIATFVTHESVEGLQRRDDPHRQFPYQLHAVELDAVSGRFLKAASWGSDYRRIGVIARDDGGLTVFLGDRIDFYSAELVAQKGLDLTQQSAGKEVLSLSSSPTGRTMLIQFGDDVRYEDDHSLPWSKTTDVRCVLIKDGVIVTAPRDCGSPIAHSSTPEFQVGTAISDGEMAVPKVGGLSSVDVSIGAFDGRRRKICSCASCYLPQFTAEDSLLVWDPRSVRIVRDDGKKVWSMPPGAPLSIRIYSYASGPQLLALPVQNANSPVLLDSVVVYKLSSGKRLFRVKNEGSNSLLQGLALSPDGGRLAVEIDGVVRGYTLSAKYK
jgi:hypothetical protein